MNAQAILQKIEDDARATAKQLASEAEQKANEMKAASEQRMQILHDELVKQAKTEGEAQADRMSRMAELDMRKQLLQKKREVISEAFEAAAKEICGQPSEKTRAFMLSGIANFAQGGEELLVGANNDAWFDDGFMADLNKKVGEKELTLAKGRRENVTGAVLLRGGTEVLVTFESIIDNERIILETEIAKILFNE